MEQWFDLHLYVANWGTRRLMMKVPTRFLEETAFVPFVDSVDWVETWTSGDNLIIDISRDEEDPDYDPQEQPDWLDDLEPLRADLLAGDLRFLYLLWLGGVDEGEVPDDALEPLPGLGPISGALDASRRLPREMRSSLSRLPI